MTEPGYEIGRDSRGLTRREREVLVGIVAGRNLVEIAGDLSVSKQRVDTIVKKLIEKGALTRTGDTFEVTLKIDRT